MNFYVMQIIQHNQNRVERFTNLQKGNFESIKQKGDFSRNDIFYEFKTEKTDDYIWCSFDYGRANPRDENVTNIQTGEKRENPRQENEVEETEQFFVLYKYDHYLYLSHKDKKATFKDFLKNQINLETEIKDILITKEEFINKLQEVSEMSFTNTSNLFNQNSKERKALVDLTGTDAPESFTIKAKYQSGYIARLKKFLMGVEDSNLIIKGKDESGFEKIYNAETFSQKIGIDVSTGKNGKYEPDTVKTNLLSKLKD